jgi:uncharacterized protein (TIGR03382 family)
VYGAIAEGGIAAAVCVLFAWVWLRERRRVRGTERPPAEMND